jgi:general secretion pathway protein H
MTAHQEERTEEGRGEIYFFPSGYVERAYIFLKRDEEVYTIETLPMKGVGIVHPEELDSRDLLDRG